MALFDDCASHRALMFKIVLFACMPSTSRMTQSDGDTSKMVSQMLAFRNTVLDQTSSQQESFSELSTQGEILGSQHGY